MRTDGAQTSTSPSQEPTGSSLETPPSYYDWSSDVSLSDSDADLVGLLSSAFEESPSIGGEMGCSSLGLVEETTGKGGIEEAAGSTVSGAEPNEQSSQDRVDLPHEEGPPERSEESTSTLAGVDFPFMRGSIATDSNISYVGNLTVADKSVEMAQPSDREPCRMDSNRTVEDCKDKNKDEGVAAAQHGGKADSSSLPVCLGFSTGSNKKIIVTEEQLKKADAAMKRGTPDEEAGDKRICMANKQSTLLQTPPVPSKPAPPFFPDKVPGDMPMRRYNCPERGHAAVKARADSEMAQIYQRVAAFFRKEEADWIAIQFKWTWLHFILNPPESPGQLESAIIDVMKLRREREYSILRRIAEFDDVACRYMVLGVLGITGSLIELYDGYYSATACVDQRTLAMLKAAKTDMGSRLHIFGAELLTEEPTSIFELNRPLLRLCLNGTKVCNEPCRLGARKKVAFLNKIAEIHPEGGTVSAIIVRVVRVIETKYLICGGNYRKVVEDPEAGLESAYELAAKAGRTDVELKARQFTRLIVADASSECLVTWWGSPEKVQAGEQYKMIYLRPVAKSAGLHLSTSNKSYIEKLNDRA